MKTEHSYPAQCQGFCLDFGAMLNITVDRRTYIRGCWDMPGTMLWDDDATLECFTFSV